MKKKCKEGKESNPKDRVASNRLDLSLWPDTATVMGALAMVEGDLKYGGYNYRVKGARASVYKAGAERHLISWFNGEDRDPKTGVHHLGSVLANIAILVDSLACGKLNDDRPPPCEVGELLRGMEPDVERLRWLFEKPDGPVRFTRASVRKKK